MRSILLLGQVWVTCWILGTAAIAAPVVENFKSQETVRNSVVLLRGTVEGGAKDLSVRAVTSGNKPVESTGLISDGRFKALVELRPGANTIELKTDRSGLPLTITLTYQPIADPHYVRLIWLTGKDGDADFVMPDGSGGKDYEARLATAALLMQSFTAERMHELGYGRRTFRLETNPAGRPLVHTVKAPVAAEHFQEMADDQRMWRDIASFLDETMPDPNAKNLVLMSFTRKDPATGKMKAHTALGGGNLGLFGSASMFCWPDSIANTQAAFMDDRKVDPTHVHEDSAGRGLYWAVASTTIGATLHEMGHSFGLPHCKDARCIMTRGFDRLNRFMTFTDPYPGRQAENFSPDQEAWFAPVSASFLRWSPWFQPDPIPSRERDRPMLAFDEKKQEVTIESRVGIRWSGFYEGGDIRGFKEFKDETAPRKATLTKAEIMAANDGKLPDKITGMDENGRIGDIDIKGWTATD